MTFNKPNPQSLVVYLNQHQKQLHTIVVVLLSLYLIAFAAKLVWRIIPEPQLSATPTVSRAPVISSSSGQNGVNIAKIQQLNLFGNAAAKPAEPVAEVTDAPETRLNLTLTGVVASSEQEAGTAIIENRGSQAVYGLGEKIEGTNATLQKVYNDRVIIKNGVRNETLMLDGIDYDEANRRREMQARNRPEPEELEEDTVELSDEALEATAALRERPANFTDFISISPKTEEGQLIGYQVSPGKEPELFKSAGLQAGDVITQINGLDLTDLQQSQEALSELRNAQTIELTIIRDGSLTTLYLDLPES
ncbi:type II secretion system protein GspC [Alteromonas sp. DY56-G5]|jgi:general secretion pathway protein C|uniref:General secretion pathway protein C n=1 Tax=Alteromonas macleodii (strain English Channel 673) TaxID=1004788 RepID=A0AB33A490_ALTME|nr:MULTISPECIES: type II secretion system protein GspC [Alteromonas]MEC7284883.1 type II secretion system protein GspC [Pseudomonadota bacterium]NKX31547.1 type II secretion system protein GspC [Alteromonadaceae bacterium A_SAG1]AFS39270.1 general secretion pathway protein C [Alteromonas macleodii ATCC 27126]AFT76462.1 general secretion pathway protein C [Alteromonas macleodii str. 'English Channel 673']AUI84300.1 type II secretion system protein GspC [Alteromonas macleodii]|tara:strand:+ start:28 stop:945 length:918 start_codon:yes stop_codon:yes gene_type:complete